MPHINESYLNLNASYLFAEIKRRTQAFRDAHPDALERSRPAVR